jgi:hypothetical protein|eukprot:COSAG02_NODE_7279_length_3086_cov_3.513559_3_plen_69_part_00
MALEEDDLTGSAADGQGDGSFRAFKVLRLFRLSKMLRLARIKRILAKCTCPYVRGKPFVPRVYGFILH